MRFPLHTPHRSFLLGQKTLRYNNKYKLEKKQDGNCLCQLCEPFKTPIGNSEGVLTSAKRKFLTVKALVSLYGINQSSIYGFIKTDPAFPYVNVGSKKKFLIDQGQFEIWLQMRTENEKREHFQVPKVVDLAFAFKNGVKGARVEPRDRN